MQVKRLQRENMIYQQMIQIRDLSNLSALKGLDHQLGMLCMICLIFYVFMCVLLIPGYCETNDFFSYYFRYTTAVDNKLSI